MYTEELVRAERNPRLRQPDLLGERLTFSGVANLSTISVPVLSLCAIIASAAVRRVTCPRRFGEFEHRRSDGEDTLVQWQLLGQPRVQLAGHRRPAGRVDGRLELAQGLGQRQRLEHGGDEELVVRVPARAPLRPPGVRRRPQQVAQLPRQALACFSNLRVQAIRFAHWLA